MTKLSPTTLRRLQKLPQIPCVWEGDRRSVEMDTEPLESEIDDEGAECILWVDGSEGIVRGMDMAPVSRGLDAVVRTLLRAMEHPHNPAQPARPQKIVVRDREILFFLRGVLQDLDIALEYVPELPLIDEIFRGLQERFSGQRPPQLPPQYDRLLQQQAFQLWQDAPWTLLSDHQILCIDLNRWGIGQFYVSILGMLGLDYGILLYRSLESLKQFRTSVLAHSSMEHLEDAFLSQDCLFVTYESLDEMDDDDDDDDRFDLMQLPWSEIEPTFGNLHPFEGLRPFLYDEEAIAVWVALEALHRFFRSHRSKFSEDDFPAINSKYKISLPSEIPADPKSISIPVSTLPDLAEEFLQMADNADAEEDDDDDDELSTPLLREDLVPADVFLRLDIIPWDAVESLRHCVEYYQCAQIPAAERGLPAIVIQTTRPKAKTMIAQLQTEGGLKAIGFNPGENPFSGESYDLGIFQTQNDELHLFGEFSHTDAAHCSNLQSWYDLTQKLQGYCCLIVAMGATGATRGNPQPKDMLALFEARSISSEELGIGPLQMLPMLSLEH
ncbi:MAG: hypothetical protein WBB29_04860 [Geitlerinemataceae cyanobacterium]